MSDNKDTPDFKDALKNVGEVSGTAVVRIGDVIGEFTKRLREDREATGASGARHAEESVVEDNEGVFSQFKAAIDNARQAYQGAQNDNDVRAAGASLLNDTDAILRDLAGSVTRAGYSTGESDEAEEAKKALRTALEEIRETLGAALSKVTPSEGDKE